MDSQSFDYWMTPGNYLHPSQQGTVFEMPPDLAKVPSLTASPVSSTFDHFSAPLSQAYYPHIVDEQMPLGSYALPMTPPDLGSDHDSPYCSPRPLPRAEQNPGAVHSVTPIERTHTTSGRRRAQNRAAQRAFRERKEKHAKNLEAQLSALNDKYVKLEVSHSELSAAYDKLRKTIELLTQDDDAEGEDDDGTATHRRDSSAEGLRKLLDMIHEDLESVTTIKTEDS